MEGRTVAGVNTYTPTGQTGEYEWITDKTVMLQFHLKMQAKDPAMSGAIQIAGIPFPRNTEVSHNFPLNLATTSAINFPNGYAQLCGTIEYGATTILLNWIGAFAQSELPLNANDLTNNTKISGMCIYTVA